MENNRENFIIKAWPIVSAMIIVVFAIGGLYTEQKMLHKEIDALKEALEVHKVSALKMHEQMQEKQEAKWGDIQEIEQRVDDLEEQGAFQDGYEQAKKQK